MTPIPSLASADIHSCVFLLLTSTFISSSADIQPHLLLTSSLQAVDSIHSVGLYCLALVPHNHLPKTPLGGIHLSETKKRFLEGSLHPVNVLMCPHTCVTNLPKPREVHSDVGPASVIVGNLVQGNRLAAAAGRDIGGLEDETGDPAGGGKKYQFIAEILRWRAGATADHTLFTLLNNRSAENCNCL